MDWDDADVRAILQLVDAAGFDELKIETDRFVLSLQRGENGAAWTRESQTLGGIREIDAATAVGTETPTTPVAEVADSSAAGLVAVKTPLPGIFYRSPKPGAPPFVEVGTRVTGDTVVAIIETMKLMNSVYAGSSGRIVSIAIADGLSVPQGTVLMQIEPSGAADGS